MGASCNCVFLPGGINYRKHSTRRNLPMSKPPSDAQIEAEILRRAVAKLKAENKELKRMADRRPVAGTTRSYAQQKEYRELNDD
jgi:hypothetical protein